MKFLNVFEQTEIIDVSDIPPFLFALNFLVALNCGKLNVSNGDLMEATNFNQIYTSIYV